MDILKYSTLIKQLNIPLKQSGHMTLPYTQDTHMHARVHTHIHTHIYTHSHRQTDTHNTYSY